MEPQISESVLKAFNLTDVNLSDLCNFGNGHINDTLLIKKKGLILQRINTNVFPEPDKLMDNLVSVTSFMRKRIAKRGGNPDRETLTFLPTSEGKYFYTDSRNSSWRLMKFISNTISLERAENPSQFKETGFCFGSFIKDLSDFPVSTLYEVIPKFHDTESRFQQFMTALKNDSLNRAEKIKHEIDFLIERKPYSSLLKKSELPLKVTHNDTKLNNILIDKETGHGICVVDLDTVMPGLAANDFGDGIRTGACTASEDEQDISKVHLDLEMYKAFSDGFVKGTGTSLTDAEIASLPNGAVVITYEQALRFLADYLNGDVYYKTSSPEHNLVRARTQIALLSDMENKNLGEGNL